MQPLLAGTLLLAISEELMFRGLVLIFMRQRYRELAAAIATSVLFGASNFLNGALNIVMSMLFGYLLYLTRRVSGGIVLPVLVDAAWDYSVFSGLTTASPAVDSSTGLVLALLTFGWLLVVIIGHRRIAPAPDRREVAAGTIASDS